MVKFNTDLRMRIISEYLSGVGSTTLSHRYGIKGSATLLHWVHQYTFYGLKGIIVRHSKKVYSLKYKLKVLNWIALHHKSYPETALHFNISSPSIIYVWERRFMNGDLHLMRNKHKSHNQNNDIKRVINQHKHANKAILKLMIRYRYHKLLKRHDTIHTVIIMSHNFHQIPIYKILEAIHIPLSSYYYRKKATLSNQKLKAIRLVKDAHKQHPNYGYRRITGCIRRFFKINHKHVQRIMQKYNLQCTKFSKKTRKYNSYHGSHHIFPNLLNRNFKTDLRGYKLVTDVSEFRYGNQDIHHRVYLSPVMDLYNDEVVAYNISNHPTLEFTLKPLKQALNTFKGLPYRTIVHSDQGIQYQSPIWTRTLKKYNALQSMSNKGTCLDNAQMESFFHIMKAEMMDKHYQTKGQVVESMRIWIHNYNHSRIKQKLGYKSPIEYRQSIA